MSVFTLAKPSSLKENIWILLQVRRGAFWQRPTLGSKLYQLRTAPAIDATAKRAVAIVEEALSILVIQGRASSVSATASLVDNTRLQIIVIVIDSAGEKNELSTFVPVGVIA